MRKKGIEPLSQEPESYVIIHYTTRADILIIQKLKYYINNLIKIIVKEF